MINTGDTTIDLNCNQNGLSCKLTKAAFQQRRYIDIADLKEQITERSGYTFYLIHLDKMLDTLPDFIKTERAGCDFLLSGYR